MAALTRDEAIAQLGWAGYCRYVGDQFKYEQPQVEVLVSAYFNGRLVDRNWDDKGMPTDAELTELESKKQRRAGDKVDPNARKSKSNPAHQGNDVIYMIDLQRGLARLDPHYREVLVLHHREGLTQIEIGEIVSVTRQTVSLRLTAAIGQLTNLMNGVK